MPSLPSPPDTTSHKQPTPSAPHAPEKATLPPSLAHNTDAVALRAALSILLTQRAQAERDIFTLDDLNEAARRDPTAFVRALQRGELSAGESHDERRGNRKRRRGSGEESEEEQEGNTPEEDESAAPQLPRFPAPQNIVRCPPVNWAKYRILAEPLERMHNLELRAPTLGVPAPPVEGKRDGFGTTMPGGAAVPANTMDISSSSQTRAPATVSPAKSTSKPTTKDSPARPTSKVSPPIVVRVPPLPPQSTIMGDTARGEDFIAAPYRPFEDKVSVVGVSRPRRGKGKKGGHEKGEEDQDEEQTDTIMVEEEEDGAMDVDESEETEDVVEEEEEVVVEEVKKQKGRKGRNAVTEPMNVTKKMVVKKKSGTAKDTTASRTRSRKS